MTTTERTLADAVAAMVASHDVADALAHLVNACAAAYPSDAVAVLVRGPGGALELLSSTSHRVDALELLQIQSDRGPCVEAMDTDQQVIAVGAAELIARWGDVGEAIVAAGFDSAHAFPMHWHGEPIGGLNIFLGSGQDVDRETGQLFADLATMAVLQTNGLPTSQLLGRVHEAVASRALIEQAKGVLAVVEDLDMDAAYADLVGRARRSGQTLTAVAADVVAHAHD